jgi:hypothetical protein
MLTFDGAAREVCTARRVRTNTPLQALVTLNDEAFLDAARHLAKRMQKESPGPPVPRQLETGYALATGKRISPQKLGVLERLYHTAKTYYETEPEAARQFCGGEGDPHLAALVTAANTLLNLDEFVTK